GRVGSKSGYGLSVDGELRRLVAVGRPGDELRASIVPTLLAAHTVPAEFRSDREGYLRLVCAAIIPRAAAAGLARFCDVFVEHGAFTADEARRVFAAAKAHGLRPKLHADQLSDTGGAA